MTERFSDRQGYRPPDAEITIREDAPHPLRHAILQIAKGLGMGPKQLREKVCEVLLVTPDYGGNWSDPNVWREVQWEIENCDWYKVYDIAEKFYEALNFYDREKFSDRLNQFFREKGIGWEMQEGQIVLRGEAFSEPTKKAISTLNETGRTNAAQEIQEAIQDISRRPQPDITGAIQHAMAGLEATARDLTGQPNDTLGKLIPKIGLPKPLDAAVEKMWGYASNHARHIQEGQVANRSDAELVVSVACAVCTFLVKRNEERNSC